MATRKQKGNTGCDAPAAKNRPHICIIHVSGHEDDHFIPFTSRKVDTNEKLSNLQSIRQKRLAQPLHSPLRMEVVCDHIPESLESMYLDQCGYHRGCYKMFTYNHHQKIQVLQNNASTIPLVKVPLNHYFLLIAFSVKKYKSKLLAKLRGLRNLP